MKIYKINTEKHVMNPPIPPKTLLSKMKKNKLVVIDKVQKEKEHEEERSNEVKQTNLQNDVFENEDIVSDGQDENRV